LTNNLLADSFAISAPILLIREPLTILYLEFDIVSIRENHQNL
jgi:hypothetical protein